MKNYRELIKELPSNRLVCTFGEFQPPTAAHEFQVKAVKKLAEEYRSDYLVLVTSSLKEDYLPADKKVQYMNLMFPVTNIKITEGTIEQSLRELSRKYKNLVLVISEDLTEHYQKIVKKANLPSIEIISAGDADPDSNKLCESAKKGDYTKFKKGLPSSLRELDSRRLMNDLRQNMGLDMVRVEIKFTVDEVRDSPECTYDANEGRLEGTISIDQYAELGFSLSEETIAQYCVDASRVENWLNSGAPGQAPISGRMNEVMQVVMGTMNAMMTSVEINAANAVASAFGNNLANSPSAPTTVSLPFIYAATNLPVYKGMSDLRHQFAYLNRQAGLPQIVGGGIFDIYNASNPFFGLNLGGIDMGKTVTPKQYDYYPSNAAPTEFGNANKFAVIAPNSAMMFNRTRNKGSFGGLKADGSYYGYVATFIASSSMVKSIAIA